MNCENSHLEVFLKIDVPEKYAKILKSTFKGVYLLVKLQTVGL